MNTQKKQRTIILGVSASIAAYRAADIASALTQRGHCVNCVLSANAADFVSPLVLGTLSRNPVLQTLAQELPGIPGHIALADAADVVLVAPATANLIAQTALGLAPDALTSVLLATRAPIFMAPAMNTHMWLHPATQAHVSTLKSRGIKFLGPSDGMLACGYEGPGKLLSVDDIVSIVTQHLES
jgi:phosphopantothenoylcysteine decarboxylase/phosphopantothenoylcysteine decarboxylase/phosphopantothenate--cysteine ligase